MNEGDELKDLSARLAEAQERQKPKVRSGMAADGKAFAFGMRLLVELGAAFGVSILLGLWLDRWLATKPWFLLLFVVLGLAAGVFNIVRAAKEYESGVGRGIKNSSSSSENRDDRPAA